MNSIRTTSAIAILAVLAAAAAHAQETKSREHVRAELAEAIRTSDLLATGESGVTLRELYRERYAASAERYATSGHGRGASRCALASAVRLKV